jgi:hypothetical protein
VTDITDAEAAEVLWTSSEQGKAAVEAAWEKASQMGLRRSVTGSAASTVTMADITAIVYAAYQAAGWDSEPDTAEEDDPVPPACEHDWAILKAQDSTPKFPFSAPHTAVLGRCKDCGQPETWLLVGTWTRDDLAAWTDPHLAGQWEAVRP